MSEHERDSIADNERSPVSEAADKVDFGPSGLNPEDEQLPEPPGTAEAVESKPGHPTVPPSRGTVH